MPPGSETMQDHRSTILFLATSGALALLYLLGTFFPQPLWGVNGFAFLPPVPSLLAVAAVSAGVWFLQRKPIPPLTEAPLTWPVPLAIALAYGTICALALPVADYYGDALFIRPLLTNKVETWNPIISEQLLHAPLDPKASYPHFYGMLSLGACLFGGTGAEVMHFLQVVLGATWAFLWVRTVRRMLPAGLWQWALGAVGLLSPLILLFTGHAETYFLPVVIQLGFGILLVRFWEMPTGGRALGMLGLTFLAIYTHVSGFILLPSVGLVLVRAFVPKVTFAGWNGKQLAAYVLLPLLVLGSIVYLKSTGGTSASRAYTKETLTEHIFLPIFTADPAPLDRYSLFSPNHFLDFFNLLLSYSTGLWAVLLGGGLAFRRQIRWHSQPLLFMALHALLMVGTFFLLNPLLSVLVDWDLLLIPAVPLLLLAVVVAREIAPVAPRWVPAVVLGLACLGGSLLAVHTSQARTGDRVFEVGKWVYKTYYIGASTAITQPRVDMAPAVRKARLEEAIDELRPWAVPGVDTEMAGMLSDLAKIELETDPASPRGAALLEESLAMDPLLRPAVFQIISVYYMQGRIDAAYAHVDLLVQMGFPTPQRSLMTAVQVSVEAGQYESARRYAANLLELEPKSEFNQQLAAVLKGPNPAAARNFFRQQ